MLPPWYDSLIDHAFTGFRGCQPYAKLLMVDGYVPRQRHEPVRVRCCHLDHQRFFGSSAKVSFGLDAGEGWKRFAAKIEYALPLCRRQGSCWT
jgi:hypothetical protein